LVHLPGIGDFQMSQIDAPFDPFSVDKNKNKDLSTTDQNEKCNIRILDQADITKQESLDAENTPDPMDGEQTWPTNEEIEMAEKESKVCLNIAILTVNCYILLCLDEKSKKSSKGLVRLSSCLDS
jgi:hypothetical protein